jgi:Ca-activated chloride channel family protein
MITSNYAYWKALAEDRERYNAIADNPVHLAAETPVSTFSIDVDTGSYSNGFRRG